MATKITPEVIEALNTLRVATKYHSVPDSLKDAINTLDNADIFQEIDLAADEQAPKYELITAQQVRKGDCISFKVTGNSRQGDRIMRGLVDAVFYTEPMVLSFRQTAFSPLESREFSPTAPMRRYRRP